MKNKVLFAALIAVSVVFNACLNTNGVEQSDNADVISFSLKTGTSQTFPTTTFNIDTVKKLITNVDSLPYLTRIDSLVPVVGTVNASSIKVNGIDYKTTGMDTLNFSDTVKIVVKSENGKNTKEFNVVLSVHKADPDLYVWTPQKSGIYAESSVAEKLIFFNSKLNLYVKTTGGVVKLYTLENDENWQVKSLTNFPNSFDIKYIVRYANKLYIAENQEIYVSSDGILWTKHDANKDVNHILFVLNEQIYGIFNNTLQMLDTAVFSWSRNLSLPSKFPVEGGGICVANATAGNERVYVVGGKDSDGNLLNSVWSTENGMHWTNLASKNLFSERQNVAVMQYDNVMLLFGGRNNSGVLGTNECFFISPDYGVSWRAPYDNMAMPIDLVPRFDCQAVLNDNKTVIYLVGGQNDSGFVKDAWKGFRNNMLWSAKSE
ncbi:MAG: DUF6242 domain-containing protein [Prevotellaceae bacterium]|jgi:hypothetical protein|nr:DUF6242 domain-containing protein [Prevotellaceae bacterium]